MFLPALIARPLESLARAAGYQLHFAADTKGNACIDVEPVALGAIIARVLAPFEAEKALVEALCATNGVAGAIGADGGRLRLRVEGDCQARRALAVAENAMACEIRDLRAQAEATAEAAMRQQLQAWQCRRRIGRWVLEIDATGAALLPGLGAGAEHAWAELAHAARETVCWGELQGRLWLQRGSERQLVTTRRLSFSDTGAAAPKRAARRLTRELVDAAALYRRPSCQRAHGAVERVAFRVYEYHKEGSVQAASVRVDRTQGVAGLRLSVRQLNTGETTVMLNHDPMDCDNTLAAMGRVEAAMAAKGWHAVGTRSVDDTALARAREALAPALGMAEAA